jgi:hypothetical protein
VVATRSRGGAGDVIRGFDFFGGITHTSGAGISAQRGRIRKGFMKISQVVQIILCAKLR